MMKVVIAGGSGFIGSYLSRYFSEKGWDVIVLTRMHRLDEDGVQFVKWDGQHLGAWQKFLNGAVVLINLNGKSVNCRYTEHNKQLIYDTRINATNVLGQALQQMDSPPKVWINASSVTIYRQAFEPQTEADGELGSGFSVDVCKKWERSFFGLQLPGVRQVALRTAIVIGKSGGVLMPYTNMAKAGFGGSQGNGKQYFSWIHEEDLARIIEFVISSKIDGIINAAAPQPVPNRVFMAALRKSLRVPFGLPMPEILVKAGAGMIGTEEELLLKSRYVVPDRLLKNGFDFKYSEIEDALASLLS